MSDEHGHPAGAPAVDAGAGGDLGAATGGVAAPPGGEPSEAALDVVRGWFHETSGWELEASDAQADALLARLAALTVHSEVAKRHAEDEAIQAERLTDAEMRAIRAESERDRALAALPVEGEPVLTLSVGGHGHNGFNWHRNLPPGEYPLYLRPQPAGAPELVTIKLDDTHTRDVTVADLAERYERQRVTLVEMNAEEARRDALAKGAPDGLREWIVTAQRRAYGQEYRAALADVLAQLDRLAPGQHVPPTAPSAEHGTVSVPGGLRELRKHVSERYDAEVSGDVSLSTPVGALTWVLAAIDDRLSASSGERYVGNMTDREAECLRTGQFAVVAPANLGAVCGYPVRVEVRVLPAQGERGGQP